MDVLSAAFGNKKPEPKQPPKPVKTKTPKRSKKAPEPSLVEAVEEKVGPDCDHCGRRVKKVFAHNKLRLCADCKAEISEAPEEPAPPPQPQKPIHELYPHLFTHFCPVCKMDLPKNAFCWDHYDAAPVPKGKAHRTKKPCSKCGSLSYCQDEHGSQLSDPRPDCPRWTMSGGQKVLKKEIEKENRKAKKGKAKKGKAKKGGGK